MLNERSVAEIDQQQKAKPPLESPVPAERTDKQHNTEQERCCDRDMQINQIWRYKHIMNENSAKYVFLDSLAKYLIHILDMFSFRFKTGSTDLTIFWPNFFLL